MTHPLFLASLAGQPVCLLPEKAEIVARVLARDWSVSFQGSEPQSTYVDLEAANLVKRSDGQRYRMRGNLALVPVEGLLMHRESFMSPMSGYTGYNNIIANLRAAEADRDVDGIVLDIKSPGGSGWGVEEVSHAVAELSKPSMAAVDYLCASAAYWIASQADHVVAPSLAAVGSIGVYTLHVDTSRALDAEGIAVTFIHAGKHKVDGNQYEPLSDDVRAEIQDGVDKSYQAFVAAVASGRSIREENVRQTEAAIFDGDQALALGLIDEVSLIEPALDRFSELVS